MPALLGYLLAGVVIGPFTPGFVADQGIANQLQEIGVTLLMFGVGLHFSIKDLWAVRRIALPGAIVQIAVATLMGALLGRFLGWSWPAGIVFGLSLSVASTVVLLRALGERRLVETAKGRIAIGWLIVEDLVTVFALVALPALSVILGGKPAAGHSESNFALDLGLTLLKVTGFVVAMLLIGTKVFPHLLGKVARMRSRELFTLGVLAIALGIAFGASALFGVTPALGAFFAGVVISESDLSHQAGAETLPLQEAFSVLFFVSIGMLFDPQVLINNPLALVLGLFVVMVGKSLAAAVIVLFYRYPIGTALTIAASLAQIGEFSFILISLSTYLELVPKEASSIVLGVAILSIGLNPVIFSTIAPIDRWLKARPKLLDILERPRENAQLVPEPDYSGMEGHAVIVGYGRVGATIGKALDMNGLPYIVVDQDRNVTVGLRERGLHSVFGDAARPGVLAHTNIDRAKLVIVATPDRAQAKEVLDYAWKVNPDIDTCVRTHSFSESQFFADLGVKRVIMGEIELALEMSEFALESLGIEEEGVEGTISELRAGPLKPPV